MTVRFIPELAGITPYQPGPPVAVVQRRFGLERVVKLASNEFDRLAGLEASPGEPGSGSRP
jgi:hypothetical protein